MTTDERFHALDALRASALMLGILLHASLAFVPGFGATGWPLSDASESVPLGVFFYVVHIFRMATFFLVAGFFARLLFQRLGAGGFIRNRLRRIALPLVVFYPVVVPLSIACIIWAAIQIGMKGPGGAKQPPGIPWVHLWFLYLLLVLYVLVLVGRSLVTAMDRRGALRSLVDRALLFALAYRIAPLLLAAPLAALLYATPWWIQWGGIPAPLAGFVPSAPSVLIFGAALLFGWCLHRQQSLLELLRRDHAFYLLAAALASLAALKLVGMRMNVAIIAMPPGVRATYAGVYMLAVWCWSLGTVGAAVSWLSAPNARWRYLSDASYWMYLVHVPIVWGLQAAMIRWSVHWSIKFALILIIAGGLLLASYHYLVRSTFIGKFLNGRKYPRALPVMAVAPGISAG
jgi:glucan biosynthesis protein C